MHLTNDPSVVARGRVREVAPQADPVTRTFEVKVGLTDPPAAMRLGATVTGRVRAGGTGYHRDSGDGTDEVQSSARRLDRRSGKPGGVDPQRRRAALRPGDGCRLRRTRYRRDRGHCRRAGAASGPEGARARIGAMRGFNLSEWALNHRSIVAYLMIVAVAAGVLLLLPPRPQRGPYLHHQDDGGPGRVAGGDDRGHAQAGHRAARAQAAGDAQARFPAQLHDRRRDDDLRQSAGQHDRQGSARHLVPRAQEHRRHPPHPAGGHRRPGLQRRFRRHLRHHLRLHGRRLHASRAARLCREPSARSCSAFPTSPRSRSWAPRTRGSSSSSR